jgi:hypothetical protein
MKQLARVICELNQEFELGLNILGMNDYGIGYTPVTYGATPSSGGLQTLVTNAPIERGQNHDDFGGIYNPIFRTQKVQNTLAETISKQGQTQLHTAETEKYAHVTYFLNGGSQEKHQGEEWELIPSNKVNAHSEKPEMKAKEITDFILEKGIGQYNYIIVNYANPDMVAHTGLVPESIASMEFLDEQLGRLITEVEANGHSLVIIADHGNCEFVGEYTRKAFSFSKESNKEVESIQNLTDTEHNPNPVPCIIVNERFRNRNPPLEGWQSQTDGVDNRVTFINKFLKTSKNQNITINESQLTQILGQKNYGLVNSQTWLTQEQINKLKENQLPLWYAGILLLSL